MNKRLIRTRSQQFVIGLTGGIATGKTTLTLLFERLGATVICCDMLAHEALKPKTPTYAAIVRAFGRSIVGPKGILDREQLAAVVFANKAQRAKLERIIHPYVFKRITEIVRRARGIVVIDVPLLFETGFQRHVDETIVVACTQKEQLKRLMKRNGLSRTAALKRIHAQMPLREKKKLADWVIPNDSLSQAVRTATTVWNDINTRIENEKR